MSLPHICLISPRAGAAETAAFAATAGAFASLPFAAFAAVPFSLVANSGC